MPATDDAPGCLHHVIVRRIEPRAIFVYDIDRERFVKRLAGLAKEWPPKSSRGACRPTTSIFCFERFRAPLRPHALPQHRLRR